MKRSVIPCNHTQWRCQTGCGRPGSTSPPRLHTCGAGLMSLLRLQRASLRVCVHMCTVDAHTCDTGSTTTHHSPAVTTRSQHADWRRLPWRQQQRSQRFRKTIINGQQREGLLLGGPLEYEKKKEKKRNQNQVGLQIPAFQMFMFQVPDWQTSKQLFH